MAKQVQKFQSDAGGLFDTECAALKDDLRHQIMQVTKNEKIANDLADHIVMHLAPEYPPAEFHEDGTPMKQGEMIFMGWSKLIASLSDC